MPEQYELRLFRPSTTQWCCDVYVVCRDGLERIHCGEAYADPADALSVAGDYVTCRIAKAL